MQAHGLPWPTRFKRLFLGAYANGPLWARDVTTIEGRKLKGIVIKYR
ncbi:hypothetical protein [Pseudomonas laurylsulfatiphila]|jgi:hypothetical protein